MKRIFIATVSLFHIVGYADSLTLIQSQQSLNNVFVNSSINFNYQGNNSTHTVYVPNSITFSIQHRSFHRHTAAPQYNLDRVNTNQGVQA